MEAVQNQKYKFSQIKKYLKDQPVIRFKGMVKVEEKNPVEFIKNFFVHNKTKPTVYDKNMEEQITTGRRRSIGDIYRICSFYFPRLTITTTYKTLLQMVAEGKALSSICEQTGLRVYRAAKAGENIYLNGIKTDEFYTDLTQFEECAKCKSISGAWGYDFKADKIKFIEL